MSQFFSIYHKVLKLGYAIGFPLVGIALCCNHWIIGFYTNSESLIQLAFTPFVVMLLNYTFALPGYVYLNAVGGTGKNQNSLSISGDNDYRVWRISIG